MSDESGREPEERLPVPRPPAEVAPVERFTSAPSVRAVELTPERAAQVVRQSSNARWVGFLGRRGRHPVHHDLLVLRARATRDHRHVSTAKPRPAGHGRGTRLQPVRGELRALPRRERRGWDRADAQSPGQAVRPSVGRLPEQRPRGRWPLRLRQPELVDADLVQRRPPAGTAELHPDRGSDRVHPRPIDRDVHGPRPIARGTEGRPDHGRGPHIQGLGRPCLQTGTGRDAIPGLLDDRVRGRIRFTGRIGCAVGFARAIGCGSVRLAGRLGIASGLGETGSAVKITASGIAFTTPAVTAPADTPFVIDFDNQDASTPHNVEIKDSTGAVKFKGDIFPGVATKQYQVPALAAGTYPFQCTVHPNMTGTLTAQ